METARKDLQSRYTALKTEYLKQKQQLDSLQEEQEEATAEMRRQLNLTQKQNEQLRASIEEKD